MFSNTELGHDSHTVINTKTREDITEPQPCVLTSAMTHHDWAALQQLCDLPSETMLLLRMTLWAQATSAP